MSKPRDLSTEALAKPRDSNPWVQGIPGYGNEGRTSIMVVTSLLPVVVLLLMMPIGLLGIVLFIVGLVKKKPAMWASGIAVAVLGLLVFTVGAGALMYLGARSASTRMLAVRAAAVKSMAVQNTPFKKRTGLDLPPGTDIGGQSSRSIVSDQGGTTRFVMLQMAVPSDFDVFLTTNFRKAQWPDVVPTFQAGRVNDQFFLPGDAQLQAMSLYVLTNPPDSNSSATVTTAVAHDAGANQAWMVSVEKAPPATQPYWKPDQ